MEITSRRGRLSNSGWFGTSLPLLVEERGNVSCITDLLTQCMRVPDFVTLMKPRVMALAVFTALVGLMIAPGHLDPLLGYVAILAIAAGAGAAGVLNMWYDADIDAKMARTAKRPIPRGEVSRAEALAFGLVLAGGAVAALGFALNVMAAALLAFAIFFYVVVYTMWLKRRTPQNIVIGGAAGALPPVIGWVAATGEIGLEPLILFLIVFLWTPPHFWALSLNRAEEYARAGVPMLPVVAGRAATRRQILIYGLLLVPVSMLPWALGFAGAIYGAVAAVSGTILVARAVQLRMSREADGRAAHRLFAFSIAYLFVLFAALLISSGSNRGSSILSARAGWTAAGSIQPEILPSDIGTAFTITTVRADEV
jgi:protoheme IX farnesyltransferase